jgi:hypothetical protein
VFVYSFLSFFSLAFGRSKNWMAPKARSWKHISMSFSTHPFRAIQLLDLQKANSQK